MSIEGGAMSIRKRKRLLYRLMAPMTPMQLWLARKGQR